MWGKEGRKRESEGGGEEDKDAIKTMSVPWQKDAQFEVDIKVRFLKFYASIWPSLVKAQSLR